MRTVTEVQQAIEAFLDSPANRFGNERLERCWGSPLVGSARGDDPLWATIKGHIGPFYWTPLEALREDHPGQPAEPADVAVISWVLPQTQPTRVDNAREDELPSERWARAKYQGERINDQLRAHLVQLFSDEGIPAVAPLRSARYREATSPAWGRASCWSERHAAHVAGLGTFGLCDGLITAVGKAHRCGSVVALLPLEPASRPYSGLHDYCLFYRRGSCAACVRRCPAGALGEAGHDKVRCGAYLEQVRVDFLEPQFGLSTGACGLCQTKVPCESGIPPR